MNVLLRRLAKLSLCLAICCAALVALQGAPPVPPAPPTDTGEPQWIWAPPHLKDRVPVGSCYFRKIFDVTGAESARVQITCDDRYELYVNGRLAGQGTSWKQLDSYDIKKFLVDGRNVVAVKALNVTGSTAGLVARVTVKSKGGTEVSYSTDQTWKASTREFSNWERVAFNESAWTKATAYGEFGVTAPWGEQVATTDGSQSKRFSVKRDFRIERVVGPESVGSLIAMAFNEWGEILVSREQGSLLLVSDKNQDGVPETVTTYCDKITNCQGILPLNGDVFAVADGPEGAAFYRLKDEDRDGVAEKVTAMVRFTGGMAEHGPHGVTLGPDGLIYIMLGNFTGVATEISSASQFHHFYEGDLVLPKYEDGGGHDVGIKAPGGIVIRTNPEATSVEVFAGGLRNAYDLAFNKFGDLFTFDSDMEWDEGMPWYRPTRVNHITAGGEFGWRAGWSKWPTYFLDSLPPTLETGRGSPTGVEVYTHQKFPAEYHNAIFAGDWSQGRILAFKTKPSGGSYAAVGEVFLFGQPLNVTDLAVGPDGWLYFVTGGRGTEGGIYRVVYTGQLPAPPAGPPIAEAIRQPQLSSAWGRQRVAAVQAKLGEDWARNLLAVVEEKRNHPDFRARALDLMQLYGPLPTPALLVKWSNDEKPELRAKAAYLMGLHSNEATIARLAELVKDPDPRVRRMACESVAQRRHPVPVEALFVPLADADRYVATAARRALERQPIEQWRDKVLASDNPRLFLQGSTALLTLAAKPPVDESRPGIKGTAAHQPLGVTANVKVAAIEEAGSPSQARLAIPSSADPPANGSQVKIATEETAETGPVMNRESLRTILAHGQELMKGYMSDADFVDLLRVFQLTLAQGELSPSDLIEFRQTIAREYPSASAPINRELIRILAYLDEPGIVGRVMEQLKSDIPEVEKVHIAFHARFLTSGWTTDHKFALIEYFEKARSLPAGYSMAGYLDNVLRDFAGTLTAEERERVLAQGDRWPTVTLQAVARLPERLSPSTVAQLIELDAKMAAVDSVAARRLQTGIVAVMGRSADEQSLAHLRESFQKYPERREELAMGLAQSPGGENLPLLLRALPIVEGGAAQEVMMQLAKVPNGPRDAETMRQVILCGLRLKENGGKQALKLLESWTRAQPTAADAAWPEAIAAWQKWYAQEFPQAPAAELPTVAEGSRWSYDELLASLSRSKEHPGDALRGAVVFEKAQCIKCHRFGGRGEGIGPDLSTISQRFQKKEILQAIMFPSHVVSDQYASKIVTTSNGLTYTGIVGSAGPEAVVILQSSGEKVTVAKNNIEQTTPTSKSAMPDGLLNALTLDEIADLFALLISRPEVAQETGPKLQR